MDDLRFLNRLVQDVAPDEQQFESARRSLLDHIDASQMRDQLRSLVDPVPDDTITITPRSTQTRSTPWRSAAIRPKSNFHVFTVLMRSRSEPGNRLSTDKFVIPILYSVSPSSVITAM